MTSQDAHTLEEFLLSYEQSLDALSALGVRIAAGRLREYRDCLSTAINVERQAPEATHAHQSGEFFQNTLLEASEIIDIATLDVGLLQDHETLTKLRQLCKGPALPNPAIDDPARNYAFEFSTAAAAARHQRLVGFSAGDFEIGPTAFPVECKRVSSLTRLESNLRAARVQLAARGRPGIIAVDLTAPIRADQGLTRIYLSESEQRDRVDMELTAYLCRHLDSALVDSVVDPMVLGLIFRHRLVGSVGSPNQIRTARTWMAFCLHGGSLEQTFDEATTWLADGPSVAGTEQDMLAAIRAVTINDH